MLLASLAAVESPVTAVPAPPALPPSASEYSGPDEAEFLAVVARARAGPELELARAGLEFLIAEDLNAPAQISRTRHQIRLVAAARAGSLSAAARLVDLGWWTGMEQVSTALPAVAAWKDDGQLVFGLRAGQIYAQLWLARRIEAMNCRCADMPALRAEWLAMIERWPVTHPMLLAKVLSVHSNTDMPRQEVVARYRDRALVAFTDDPVFAGEDVHAMLGRGEAINRSFSYQWREDRDLLLAMYDGAAARCAQHGELAGEGIMHCVKWMYLEYASEEGGEARQVARASASTLLARAGDTAHLAMFRAQVVEREWYQRPQGRRGGAHEETGDLPAYIAGAMDMCRSGSDWYELGEVCAIAGRMIRNERGGDPDSIAHSAAAWADSADAYRRAGVARLQGNGLAMQAATLVADERHHPDGGLILRLRRQAEACFASLDEKESGSGSGACAVHFSAMRLENLCALAENLADVDDLAGAHALFARVATMIHGFPPNYWMGLRRRLKAGLQAQP